MSGFFVEGVSVNSVSLKSTVNQIISDCRQGGSFSVFTLNLDHIVKLRRDKEFQNTYKTARYITADGFPIVWAGRLQGVDVDRVTGADLIEPLCAACERSQTSVYLFGSSFRALAGASSYLTGHYPDLKIVGVSAPKFGFVPGSQAAAEEAKRIAESGARLCFVALGAPKQELFAAAAMDFAPQTAFVCIGAGLDYLAGVQSRAPRWVQTVGAEWLWRLASAPRRLGRRYMRCLLILPSFLWAVVGTSGRTARARR